jgi:LacI family transcriptional regulator
LYDIEHGNLKKGDKIPSEYELADQFHVNKTTANKAVAKLVDRGFLTRSRGAGGTVVNKDEIYPRGTICFRLSLLSAYTFSSRLLKGAYQAARKRKYALDYIELTRENLSKTWQDSLAVNANGILCSGSDSAPQNYPKPIVNVSNTPSEIKNINYILCDECAGAASMAKFLLERGHRTPVLLLQSSESFHIKQRLDGYLKAFSEGGVSDISKRIIYFNFSDAFNPANIHAQLQENFPDSSVLVCASDYIAIKMIDYFERNKISVPEKISVTGYGHMREYQELRRIASIDQHPEDIGFQACMSLIDIIEGLHCEPIQAMLKPSLIKGDTVACL